MISLNIFDIAGLYGTLVNIESKVIKNNLLLSKYDYILLIDTEGLSSIEKGDEKYDKRLILFCLAISHLVIVNISNQIYDTLKQTLILCTESLNYLEATHVDKPTVHFVLNQKTDLNKANYEQQMRIIRDDLIAHGLNDVIDLGPNNFHILPSAFNSKRFSVANYEYAILSTDIKFVTDVQKLCEIFIDLSFVRKTDDDFSKTTKWIEIANSVLQIITQYPDLTYFKDNFERKQNNLIREDIGKDLQAYLSSAKGERMIDKEKENSSDRIRDSFKLEQVPILRILTSKLVANLEKRRASKNIRERSLRFLEIQVASRFRSWEVSAIMASERFKLDKIVRDGENEFRKLALDTVDGNQMMNEDLATAIFEKRWTDRFARIETEFESQAQWKQSIDLVCRLYDVFDQDALPSSDNVLTYLPFLMSLDTTDQPIVFDQSLSKICAKCQSQVSTNNPLASNSTNTVHTPDASDLLKPYKFLDTNKLASTVNKDGEKSAQTRSTYRHGVYQDFSQQISNKWQTVVRVSYCFELLTECMNKIFRSKIQDERSTEITLVQEILEAVNTLIKDMNEELDIFNFSMSKSLQSILHICAALSIALFYYYQHKTHFNNVVVSIRQNKVKWQDRFVRMVVVQENNDENIVTDLVNQLSDVLRKSFGREAEDINRKKVENELLTLKRYSFMQELDNKVYGATNEWLMRYVLHPMEIIIEQFDQRWNQVEMAMRQELNISINSHLELLAEFFRRIKLIQSALVLDGQYSLTFVDDLFQPSGNNIYPNLGDKKLCMATLIYQYLSEEFISTEISAKNGSTYTVDNKWREIITNITKQSKRLKDIFCSMKDTFETYSITYIHIFFEKILGKETEIKQAYQNYVNTLAEDSYCSTKNHLLDRIRGCQVQCPCCKRLCDVDHRLNGATPVGKGENRHQCQSGHQIRGMGGVRYEVTNEASTIWCEIIKDEDPIITSTGRRQKWVDFKISHADWDFGDPRIRETKKTPYTYIWNKIGQELCQHFGNGMKFVTQNSPIPVNHFILLLDHSGSMNENNNISLQPGTSNTTNKVADSNQTTLSPWQNLLEAVRVFIRIRIQKIRHTDQMTIIIFGNKATRIYHREELPHIDVDRLNLPMTICGTGTKFSVAFNLLIETLNEMKNDPTHINFRQTIIFLTDGEPQDNPTAQLERLSTEYTSMITYFWTMGLGVYNNRTLEQISEKMHGELKNIKEPEDLIDTYAEIADFCDTNLS